MSFPVNIFYAKISEELPEAKYREYLNHLPQAMQEKNSRFLRWQDRHANLMGKILLIEGLRTFGLGPECLHTLMYNAYGKPSLKEPVNFNISHSGEYIICAIGKEIRFGVDVEKIRPVKLDHFKSVMTLPQWEEIQAAPDAFRKFFSYWVIKESVIKADSRGLSIPLEEIQIYADTAMVAGNDLKWYIHHLDLGTDDYCAVLSADKKISAKEINLIPFFEHL